MTQEVDARKTTHTGFRRWFAAGFGGETLPIIPPDAELTPGTDVRPEHRGKTPGVKTQGGTWSGLGGKWSDTMLATVPDAKRWVTWGASVGLQARLYIGLDIDVEDAAQSAAIEALAVEHLGLAPVRFRDGSARRLLVYKRAGDAIRKRRFSYTDAAGAKQAVEALGHGQQYVVEGPHPKGGAYQWRYGESPCEWSPAAITEIEAEHLDRFFAAVATYVAEIGGVQQKGAAAAGSASIMSRKGLDNPSLWAPSPELVLEALKAWPNTEDNLPTHDDFVAALAAIKAALGPARDEFYGAVEDWALGYGGNDADYVRKTWDSITDAALGAEWLFQHARASGFTADAQSAFDDAPHVPLTEQATSPFDPEDPEGTIGETPLEKMLGRFVWVQQLERYVDIQTGAMLSARAFNAANVHIAEFGRTGVNSAEAAFQNAHGARKAAIATYRPGQDVLLMDRNSAGKVVRAVNLWHPSPVVPAQNVTDSDVQPWLDHVTEMFGEPGEPSREHFLNWCAFALQRPGVKINHAMVILGEQGVGKDTVILPVLRAIGTHNTSVIKPEMLAGQFNAYLQSQIIVVEEMSNFTKREIYNKLKDWIAAPPDTVEINRKNQQPYSIPNIQLWIFFTNYDDAIALDEDDRRFWIHRAQIDTPRAPSYYATLYRFYEASGVEKIAGWLHQRDISKFNPNARPPTTAAKQEMIEHALPFATRWLGEQLEEGGAFYGRELLAARELINHARTAMDAPPKVADTAREKNASAALRRAGYKAIERKVKMGDLPPARLWTNKSPAIFNQMEHRFLAKRYTDDMAKSEPQRKGA